MLAQLELKNDIVVINIQGRLLIEKTQEFKALCAKYFKNKKVVINLEHVSFVGSNGVQHFLEGIEQIVNHNKHGLKVVGIKPDFKRIFDNMGLTNLHFEESNETAIAAFSKPEVPLEN